MGRKVARPQKRFIQSVRFAMRSMSAELIGGKSRFFIRSAVSIAFLTGLVYQVGSLDVLARMASVHWHVLAWVVLILASHVFVITPRWAIILRRLGHPTTSMNLLGSVFLGFLCNQLLPTGVGGDAVRALRLRQLGIPLETGIHSVLLDRIAGLAAIVVGTLLLVPFAHPAQGGAGLTALVAVALTGTAAAALALVVLARLPAAKNAILAGLQSRLGAFNRSLALVLRRPGPLLAIAGLSIAGQLFAVTAIALLVGEVGITISTLDVTIVTFGGLLAATVPVSIAGWGVREGALVVLLGLYGVAPDAAFAVSVLFGICLILASAPGLLVLWRAPPRSDPEEPRS